MVQQPTAMPRPPIAHRRAADGEMQPLQDHLLAVGGLSARHASKLKLVTENGTPPAQLETVGEILGLVHDLGKYSKAFQDYLGSAVGLIDQDADGLVDANQLRGRVDHSTAGAQFIWRKLSQTGPFGVLSGEMLALCVASHHSGLIDCLTPDGDDNFTRRISKPEQSAHLEEALAKIDATLSTRLAELVEGANLSDSIAKVARSISQLEHRFGGSRQIIQFKFGLLVRFLFSGLIDADRVDTADFERPHAGRVRHHGKYPCWEELTRRLETHLHGFSDTNPVDGLRREVSRHCRLATARKLGLLTLTVPTGGGKTLASLRFALHHAHAHGLDRPSGWVWIETRRTIPGSRPTGPSVGPSSQPSAC